MYFFESILAGQQANGNVALLFYNQFQGILGTPEYFNQLLIRENFFSSKILANYAET